MYLRVVRLGPTAGGGLEKLPRPQRIATSSQTVTLARYDSLSKIPKSRSTPRVRDAHVVPKKKTRRRSYSGVHVVHNGIKYIHRA